MDGRRLLGRAERRAQIVAAATAAFARDGYAATGIGKIAAQADVTATIIYRHFTGKSELYRAALDAARARLGEVTEAKDEGMVEATVAAASEDPDGFLLLFRHAAREPEFRDWVAEFERGSAEIAERALVPRFPGATRRHWAAHLLTTISVQTILSWLDAGKPASVAEVVATIDAASDAVLDALAGGHT
ncbi:TetR/AcrR family transcriptional regulator [Amycolatopsis sp. CA-230715]|uniref:TetR/AcrR family transcriptional regulator n=1 Tax=Amycolatopsis sp. CA-230715 TaxID=2745196 RepID=UPI001C030242|nr:TetR/AcrR family transcriptional regulator [Amycolatopsis sp. CA-230715]